MAVLGRRPGPLQEATAGFDAEWVQVSGAVVTEAGALERAVAGTIGRLCRLDVVADVGTSELSRIDTFDDDVW
ncbi:hypothetical protein ABZ357_32680 [Streptomyces sp. NPDC005917]|uniref:hypothetical protein n=1 Tax=unclassified Streptomyces TaxID=2593676 RepID=UPI00340B0675